MTTLTERMGAMPERRRDRALKAEYEGLLEDNGTLIANGKPPMRRPALAHALDAFGYPELAEQARNPKGWLESIPE